MSSKEDQITDGNVVKETLTENHSVRVSMDSLRIRDTHTIGYQSWRFFEDSQTLHPLEISNDDNVPEKLRQAYAIISAQQEADGYQGHQKIQGKR